MMEQVEASEAVEGQISGSLCEQRVWVLCAHDPEIDPRIGWSAQAAADLSKDVQIHGWIATRPSAVARQDAASTFVHVRADNPVGLRAALRLWRSHQILSSGFAFQLALLAAFMGFFWFIYRLVMAPWVILDYGLEKIRVAHFTTRPVEWRARLARRWLFERVDRLAGGRIARLIEGLIGYRWYLVAHISGFASAILKHARESPEGPDVVHAHDPDALLAAAVLKRKYGCRVVFDAHESGPDAYLVRPRPRRIFFSYLGQMMRFVDTGLTVSDQLAAELSARHRLPFACIPNAAPIEECTANHADAALVDKLARGRLKFLFQGGFAPERGVELLLRQWPLIDAESCALFIRGPMNAYRSHLLNCAEETGELGQSIFFLDSTPERELISAARLADVGIIPYLSHVPNHHFACPNKLSQYMQAGLAILSTDLPFVRGIVEQAECGLIYDDNRESGFAEMATELSLDRAKLSAMRANARGYALGQYNYQAFKPVLRALYSGQA